jgi:hypothetical protein
MNEIRTIHSHFKGLLGLTRLGEGTSRSLSLLLRRLAQ